MATFSTPSWPLTNGPTSTPSLARSKRPEDLSGKQESRKKNHRFGFFPSPHSISGSKSLVRPILFPPSCFPAFLRDSSSRRVKGAWWPSRSSKSPSTRKSRGRFDSYPLRQISGWDELRKQESRKKIPAKTSAPLPSFFLLSCFPDSFLPLTKGGGPACRVSRSVL